VHDAVRHPREHGLDLVTGTGPAADALDHLAQGCAERDLGHAGATHVAHHGRERVPG
jgi:hypothetical protein